MIDEYFLLSGNNLTQSNAALRAKTAKVSNQLLQYKHLVLEVYNSVTK